MVFNDTQIILQLFEQIFTQAGYKVSLHSYEQLELDLVNRIKPDLIISDHTPTEAEEKQGWQFVQLLRMDQATENIPVIVCTMDVQRALQIEGHLAAKGMRVVIKPFTTGEILQAVKAMIGEADSAESEAGETHPRQQLKSKKEKEKQ